LTGRDINLSGLPFFREGASAKISFRGFRAFFFHTRNLLTLSTCLYKKGVNHATRIAEKVINNGFTFLLFHD